MSNGRENSIEVVNRARPKSTMSVSRGMKEPTYSQKRLIADLTELDKKRSLRKQRPSSQMSHRTGSERSGRNE